MRAPTDTAKKRKDGEAATDINLRGKLGKESSFFAEMNPSILSSVALALIYPTLHAHLH